MLMHASNVRADVYTFPLPSKLNTNLPSKLNTNPLAGSGFGFPNDWKGFALSISSSHYWLTD